MYQVKTKFCSGEERNQTFYEADAACGVYALRLGDMLMKNPLSALTSAGKHGVHIEEVVLVDVHYGKDVDSDNYLLVSSGRFPCEKKEVA